MKHNIIEVNNLVKRYAKADRNAIDHISFKIEEGCFFALLGPNGAGKTTTVSILATTLAKTSGKVTIDGESLDRNPSSIRRKLGVIFQKPSLDQNLTAEENVRFHATLYGLYSFQPRYSWMPEDYKKKVRELSQVLDLKKEMFAPIKTFSGGMKRKLEIIRSLMHTPKIMILDEPTSGLDPIARKNLWSYIHSIQKKRQITILLTTHYLEEAEGADHIVIIDKGKIVSEGTPHTIKTQLIKEYLTLDAIDRKKLTNQLAAIKVIVSKTFPLKVTLNQYSAQEVIKKISVPLTILKIHTPTLEEAYFEIINTYGTRT